MFYRITTNSRHHINNGARFYTIKMLWSYLKVQDYHPGYDTLIIKTLKFDDVNEAKKVLKKLKWWKFTKVISWKKLLDVKYFF